MGIVNHILGYLKKDFPEVAEDWIKIAGIKLDFRQQLNGNNARKLLKKTSIL